MHYLAELKRRLNAIEGVLTIESGRNPFTVTPIRCANNEIIGVDVSNLGATPYLPIDVFVAVISLLCLDNSEEGVMKGNGVDYNLGDPEFPLDSVEGHVAHVVYGLNLGRKVSLRRITPISHILAWAGVCENRLGYLKIME